MNQLVPVGSPALPALVTAAGERASMRFLEFFAANIRDPHTRRAYYRAAEEFLAWCAEAGLQSIAAVLPVHVAVSISNVQMCPSSRARPRQCQWHVGGLRVVKAASNGGSPYWQRGGL